jgi:DNA-binding response OmpR family regulator
MSRYRILAVDDDQDVLDFVKESVGDKYEVITSMDGPEALVKFKECEPDLVLLDIMMPGMSGYEVCQEMRKVPGKKEVPVIMLSALDTVEDHKAGYREGATFYLTKPIPPERLIRNIEVQLVTAGPPKPKKLSIEQITARRYWKETPQTGHVLPKEENEKSKPAPAVSTKNGRIIAVDDDDDIIRIMALLFEKDYEFLGAKDGLDALRKIHAYEPDLVIIDVMIPKVNGFQVCSAIRKIDRYVNLPIVFLTGKDDPKIREMAESLNSCFILKPCNYQELLKIVQKLIEKSQYRNHPKKVAYDQIKPADRGLPEPAEDKEKVNWMD